MRRDERAVVALATVDALDPSGLGRVVRDADERVERIVEERDATEDELDITEINAGLYAFDVAWLRQRLPDIPRSPVTGELYLPLLVAFARADRRPVATLELPDDGTLTGINDRAQLSDAELADAPAHQRRLHACRRDHDRPRVHVHRRHGRAGPGRHPGGGRHPAGHHAGRP